MGERSFASWLGIVGRLLPLYREFRALGARPSEGDLVGLVDRALGVLVAENVTLAEIQALARNAGPLIALLR